MQCIPQSNRSGVGLPGNTGRRSAAGISARRGKRRGSASRRTCAGWKRFMPDRATGTTWSFLFAEEPEYRNFAALDFVVSELNYRVRSEGARGAQLERVVIIERGSAGGLNVHDIQVAITYMVVAELLTEKNGFLKFAHNGGVRQLPSETRDAISRDPMRKPLRERVYLIVKDIIERRSDGRPRSVEALDAFAEQLNKLGFGMFRIWWVQTAAELRRSDSQTTPVATCVLAAALVEGALTFVVKHARSRGLVFFDPRILREIPEPGRLMIWWRAQLRAATLPFSIHLSKSARRRLSTRVSAFMPDGCFLIFLVACPTSVLKKRETQKPPLIKSYVASWIGWRNFRRNERLLTF